MVRLLLPLYTLVFLTVPLAVAALPLMVADSLPARIAAALVLLPLWGLTFLLVTGLLSRPHRWAIKQGRFQRSLADPVYGRRRLHALCWTSVYYSPAYPYFLSIGSARRMLFRLFGYRGALDFTCYPDTWLRDLPLLDIGSGAYLANKSTIGSNLALKDGRIFVDGITIGPGAMVGHLTMVAAGTIVGDAGEISHGTASGARNNFGNRVSIQPACAIEHRVTIGDDSSIGARSYIGSGVVIGESISFPIGSNIPRKAKISSQREANYLFSSETADLRQLREALGNLLLD
ncbi:MAG TPA: hypothetical protein VHY91_24310 [Pirellulales bacterium]|nr:hypothetical protein [Pirellulales bacterium]